MRRIAVVLLPLCLLCACGQKGNLYLPEDGREEVTAPATPMASPATAAPAAPAADAISAEERERQNAARNRGN